MHSRGFELAVLPGMNHLRAQKLKTFQLCQGQDFKYLMNFVFDAQMNLAQDPRRKRQRQGVYDGAGSCKERESMWEIQMKEYESKLSGPSTQQT